ncbi:hypothetical protein MBT84_02330 [Streptomyces sp. MBT84]|nr:hypothetical protein [Streptomyces sp. MBT84]
MTTEEIGCAREDSPVAEQYALDLWFLREGESDDDKG